MPRVRTYASLSCEQLVERVKQVSWATAMENLHTAWRAGGPRAIAEAEQFARLYAGRRAVMVFDCVLSRQRTNERVRKHVEHFATTNNAASLAELARVGPGEGPPNGHYPFMTGEAATIQAVAAGLARYGHERDLDEEAATRQWAAEAGEFERDPHSDPYVGTKGIGVALFAYLRMRCWADAIKVDSRVKAVMGSLRFPLGDGSDMSVLCVCGAAAAELGVTRLQLDQLLWFLQEDDRSTLPT